jgi:hypothetical protein
MIVIMGFYNITYGIHAFGYQDGEGGEEDEEKENFHYPGFMGNKYKGPGY